MKLILSTLGSSHVKLNGFFSQFSRAPVQKFPLFIFELTEIRLPGAEQVGDDVFEEPALTQSQAPFAPP
jgi:hypothetical protein